MIADMSGPHAPIWANLLTFVVLVAVVFGGGGWLMLLLYRHVFEPLGQRYQRAQNSSYMEQARWRVDDIRQAERRLEAATDPSEREAAERELRWKREHNVYAGMVSGFTTQKQRIEAVQRAREATDRIYGDDAAEG